MIESKYYIKQYLESGSEAYLHLAMERNILTEVFCNDYMLGKTTEYNQKKYLRIEERIEELTGVDKCFEKLLKSESGYLFLRLNDIKKNVILDSQKYDMLGVFLEFNLDFSEEVIKKLMSLEQKDNFGKGFSLDYEDLRFVVLDDWLSKTIFYDEDYDYDNISINRLAYFCTCLYEYLSHLIKSYK